MILNLILTSIQTSSDRNDGTDVFFKSNFGASLL